MRDNHMPVGKRMRDQIKVGLLQEGVDRGWLVALRGCPGTDRSKSSYNPFIRPEKKAGSARGGPGGQFILTCGKFIAHFFDAEHRSGSVPLDKPFPKGRAEIEAVVQVLGLDKDITIEQVTHQTPTPKLRPNS